LRRLLAEKEREAAKWKEQISGLQKSIAVVADRFKNETARITIEREAILKDKHKYDAQMVNGPVFTSNI
jgi:hypothetical protein